MAMVGRQAEQAELAAFVKATAGQALVLRGETGVGKSALLGLAADLAEQEGHLVVRAAGVEAESELPYAGLHQFLHPLLTDVAGLDDGNQAVFDAVFGRTEGEPPSVMTLGIAVLSLLSLAAARQPLLLVLDDGQWLDDSSADICGFVGRRLAGSPVKLLVGVRTDVASRFDTAALPELPITALSDQDAEHLLTQRFPVLGKRVRLMVLEQARGNPLALLELPAHLGGRPGDPALDVLIGEHGMPLPRRLQRLYGARIAGLSDAVRAELLMGALDGAGTRLGRAAGAAGGIGGLGAAPGARYRMRDAEEAVAAGLLEIDLVGGEYAFRHPLVRSAVVQMATPNQRRAAHKALAHVHREQLERRATHLAAATVDPDEEVADILEAAAESATRRGGALAAVAWLTRAAELSVEHTGRSRRLADAAFVAGHAARLGQAHGLVQSGLAPGSTDSPASVLASAYQALYQDGDVLSTHRQVASAIERQRDAGSRENDEVLTRLVNLLLAISQYAGDRAAWERTHALLDDLGSQVSEHSRLFSDAWSDVVRHGAGSAEVVEQAAAKLVGQEPWEVSRLAVAAYHLDILSQFRPHLRAWRWSPLLSVDTETPAAAGSGAIATAARARPASRSCWAMRPPTECPITTGRLSRARTAFS
ncbi:hypothetical protein ABH935_001233 [Catenulispora sp. GAS73]